MQFQKPLLGLALVAGFAVLPLSAASAYPCNPISGIFGAAATVVGAAVTIGTAPLVILSGNEPRFHNYVDCGYRDRGEAYRYYHPRVAYDGPPPEAYGPPPPRPYYGRPHRPRWYRRHYDAPPPPPPPGY